MKKEYEKMKITKNGNVYEVESASKKGQPSSFKGKHFSDESRAKLSAALKGREVWNKGVPMREESKAKMIEKKTGMKMSEATKRKMSESAKRHTKTPEHIRNAGLAQRGKTVSLETRKKISESLKGHVPCTKGKSGPKHSEEYKNRHSELMKKWWAKRKAEALL